MAFSTLPYKGARDFYPEDKRLQKYLFAKMRQTAELFGYEEYDASLIEPIDIYLAKTSEEIVSEQTYSFEDRGGRKVTLRPEMTPTVSRMVAAKRQELAYPLRWYSIPNVWRYERPQKGRLREHWQLNVDVFGIEDTSAELEIIQVADRLLKSFGAKPNMYVIKFNSRKLVDEIMFECLGLDVTQAQTLTRLIDRMHKLETTSFKAKADAIFTPTQRDNGSFEVLQNVLLNNSLSKLPEQVKGHDSALELHQLLTDLSEAGVTNVVYDPTLMRGFDYYTDIVFEVFDTDPENNRSMFGGGRYDGLVAQFGAEPIATVGFGAGDVTLANFLQSHNLLPELKTETDLFLIPIGDADVRHVTSELREMGVNVALGMTASKLDKQIKTAIKKGIRFALFVGETEIGSEQYKLKDLVTGQDESHSLQRVVSIVKDYRRG